MQLRLIRRNAAANLTATVWATILNLLFVPVYLRMMGIESYALVGFYATLQASLALLDLGLTPTMSRQMAQYSVQPDRAQEARDLVRTLEAFYWALAAVIGLTIVLASGLVATRWLNGEGLPPETVSRAVLLMGLVAAVQWPASLYAGGLQGLQRQTLLSAFYIGFNTVRHAGAVLVLWLVANSVTAFFSWQAVVSVGYTLLLVIAFWRFAPGAGLVARFRPATVRLIWRFAAGMGGIALLSFLQSQTDKLLLSALLPLRVFGYYVLASTVAQSLLILVNAISTAVFPRFTQLATDGDRAGQSRLYHLTAQALGATVVAAGLAIALFAQDIVLLWTNDAQTAQATGPILRVLTLAVLCTVAATTAFRLALANGWTRLNLGMGVVQVAVYIPLLVALTQRRGVIGAAWAGLALNAAALPVFVYLALRRLLPGEFGRWAVDDLLLPLAAALAPLMVCRLLLPADASRAMIFVVVAAGTVGSVLAAALSAPDLRPLLFGRLALMRKAAVQE